MAIITPLQAYSKVTGRDLKTAAYYPTPLILAYSPEDNDLNDGGVKSEHGHNRDKQGYTLGQPYPAGKTQREPNLLKEALESWERFKKRHLGNAAPVDEYPYHT